MICDYCLCKAKHLASPTQGGVRDLCNWHWIKYGDWTQIKARIGLK